MADRFTVYLQVEGDSLPIKIARDEPVARLRIAASRKLGVDASRVQLCCFLQQVKVVRTQVLMTDSWPSSKFALHSGSVVLAAVNRQRDFPELPEFEKSIQQQLVEACRRGMLDAVRRHFEMFEQMGSCDLTSSILCIFDKPVLSGWTCLHFASHFGHKEVVEFLIEKGADVNAMSLDGWTPLLLATNQQSADCVDLLTSSKCLEVNQVSAIYGTALHLAAKLGADEIAAILLQRGASPVSKDNEGCMPIELATTQEIVELIPKYVGRLLLSQVPGLPHELFRIDEALEEVPPPFCGYIQFAEVPDRRVYLMLDPSARRLSRFTSRDHCLDSKPAESTVALSDVLELERAHCVEDRKSYFILWHKAGRDKYFSSHEEVAAVWHQQISYALSIAQKQRVRARCSEGGRPTLQAAGHKHTKSSAGPDQCFTEESEVSSVREDVMLKSFKILEQLGQGSFGSVYKVLKKDSGEVFALKVLSKPMLLKHNQLRYAVGESKILSALDFPFIVKLYSRFQTPRSLYLLLEYCPHGDLANQLLYKEVLSEEDARFYVAEVLLALDFLHAQGIVYRDLKPDNILLDKEGHIRLTDFGLAKDGVKQGLTKSFCGSPAYLAPEMLLKKGVGFPADVYGVGAVLYELLVGKPPFYSEDMNTLFTNIKLGRLSFPWHVSAEAKELMQTLLAREPESRPTTQQVMHHPFFRSVDWKLLRAKKLAPPAFVARQEFDEEEEVLRKVIKDKDYSDKVTMEECLLDFE